MGTNIPEQITVPKLKNDGTVGEVTWNVFSMGYLIGRKITVRDCDSSDIIARADTLTANADPYPFKCPNCGGNSYYTDADGHIICEYCETMFTCKVTRIKAKPNSPIATDVPVITSYEVN